MKKIVLLTMVILCFMSGTQSYAQNVPSGISFQGIATDASGNIAMNAVVFVKSAIIKSSANGSKIYSESFSNLKTTEDGIFTIIIGQGSSQSGSFNDINWANGPYFLNLQVAIKPLTASSTSSWAPSNYYSMGTQQFWSVPYALNAGSVPTAVKYSDTAFMLSTHPNKTYVDANIATKQTKLTLSTTGTNGKATLIGSTLNIPNYAGGNSGSVTSVGINNLSGLTGASPITGIGTIGLDTTIASTKANVAASLIGYAANALVVKYADTASLLSPYYNKTAVDSKLDLNVKIADTALMLSPYSLKSALDAGLALKINSADAATILSTYAKDINTVKYTDSTIKYVTPTQLANAITAPISSTVLVGSINAASTNKGATYTDSLHLSPADSTNAGILTTQEQLIGGRKIFASSDGIFATGKMGEGKPSTLGAGLRMMWMPRKAAIRAGGMSDAQWDDSTKIGKYSTAFGENTLASGDYSLVAGHADTASAFGSVALGQYSNASQSHAIAMGYGAKANGYASISMGRQTNTNGAAAVAMGYQTNASNFATVAMGQGTTASGNQSTAFGLTTTASGPIATAMGQQTTASGTQSTAFGLTTTASGPQSTSFGQGTIASGTHTTAMGLNTTANQSEATAFGQSTIASGTTSTAMGLNTTASGSQSTAFGQGTNASGATSTAMGLNTTASGVQSTATGHKSVASGPQSFASGLEDTASATAAVAFGYKTKASGSQSFATGQESKASGNHSVALGYQNIASEDQSFATGNKDTASGKQSIAMGLDSKASAPSSVAIGNNVKAASYGETVLGIFNTTYAPLAPSAFDSTDRLFTIGNGLDDARRSNALTILKSGNTIIPGKIKTGAITYPNTDSTAGLFLTTDGAGNASWKTVENTNSVPYTGATKAVDLGAYDLTVRGITVGTGNSGVSSNTAVGSGALYNNTIGGNNTANGLNALSSNISGNGNTANGASALQANTTGNNNTANGTNALSSNTQGLQNTANGVNALSSNTTGGYNTANGTNALTSNTEGAGNTANGRSALNSNNTGSNNTANGLYALSLNSSGSYNTGNGGSALFTNSTGTNLTALGYAADVAIDGLTNATAIGNGAIVDASNTIQLGNANITNVKTSGTVTASGFIIPGGTSTQVLLADGSYTTIVREVSDEFSATLTQTNFTLTQTPSTKSKVKMYINGIRISNTAYSISGTTLTYTASFNGNYSLSVSDRIQMDYFY